MTPVLSGLLSLMGALGLFLYSISLFGDAVQKLAGEKFRLAFDKQSGNATGGVFYGIIMAAALQSNILTCGIISSLTNSGLLSLLPAIGTMLGVNLGLTLTAQLMSVNLGAWYFLLLSAGYVMFMYGKGRNWHYIGQIVFNLGIMYLSMNVFHSAFQMFGVESKVFAILRFWLSNPWIAFLLTLTLSAVLRSSNTVVVLVQGMVGVGLRLPPEIFLSGSVAMVLGANLGTTIINMITGMDRLPIVRKANWFHFSFNLATAVICLTCLPVVLNVITLICGSIIAGLQFFAVNVFGVGFNVTQTWYYIWQIAMTHTLFNMLVILVWFPLTHLAARSGITTVFNDNSKIGTSKNTFLDRRALQTPALALILAGREVKQMAEITQGMLNSARLAFLKNQQQLIVKIDKDEAIVDDMQEQITFYLSALLSQNALTETQSHRLASLLHIVSDIERVGDHATSISVLADKCQKEQLQFSELAMNEIELLFGKTADYYAKACQAYFDEKPEIIKQLSIREEGIDKFEEELRQNHIHRLNQGKCQPSTGVVYVEMLNNLQRIAAHSRNIIEAIFEEGEEQ